MHSNRLCHQREIQRQRRIHREKLQHMKPTSKTHSRCGLDNSEPTRYQHLQLRLKKHQMETELKNKIQHENCLLISKMYSIMKSERPTDDAVEFRPGIRLSKDHQPVVDCYNSNQTVDPKRAGNIEARRRNFTRVMNENVDILKRIQARKPTYSVGAWEEDRSKTERYLSNISKTGWHLNGYLNNEKKDQAILCQTDRQSRRHKHTGARHHQDRAASDRDHTPMQLPSTPRAPKNQPGAANTFHSKGRLLVQPSPSVQASTVAQGSGVLLHVAVITAVDTTSMPNLMKQFAGMVEAALKTKACGDSGMVHYHSLDSTRFLYISLGTSAHMVAMQKAIAAHARACAISALALTKQWQGKVFGAVSAPLQQMFDRENEGAKIKVDTNPSPSAGYPAVVPDGIFAFEDGVSSLLLHVGVATIKDERFMDTALDAFRQISQRAKQQSQPMHHYHVLDDHTILYLCVTNSATALAIETQLQEENCVANFSLFSSAERGHISSDSLSNSAPLASWRGKLFGAVSPGYESALAEFNASLGQHEMCNIKGDEVNPIPIIGFGSTFGNHILGTNTE